MSSLQSADLTATIVWARFSNHYLTTANGMPHIDDCLPFCCKFTANCNAKRFTQHIIVHSQLVPVKFFKAGGMVLHNLTRLTEHPNDVLCAFFRFTPKHWWHLPLNYLYSKQTWVTWDMATLLYSRQVASHL